MLKKALKRNQRTSDEWEVNEKMGLLIISLIVVQFWEVNFDFCLHAFAFSTFLVSLWFQPFELHEEGFVQKDTWDLRIWYYHYEDCLFASRFGFSWRSGDCMLGT